MASCPRPTSSLTPTVGEAKARRTEARETSSSLETCAQWSWRGVSRGKDMLVRCYQETPTSESLGGAGGVLEINAYPWAQAKTHWTKVEGGKNMLNGFIRWGWGSLLGDVREWWATAILLRNQKKKIRERLSSIRRSKLKNKQTILSAGDDVEQPELSCTAGGNAKRHRLFGKSLIVSSKFKTSTCHMI